MKLVIADARQHFAQLPHDPALAAIEEGDALAKVGYGHRLTVKGADLRRGRFAP